MASNSGPGEKSKKAVKLCRDRKKEEEKERVSKIEYFKNTLTVLIHNGMSNNEKDFELCIRSENVVLPKNGYFGVSAATGGLADDHDVLK